MSKILVVFGATGIQGGSVVRSVLKHPILSQEYSIRAVTRDPSKPAAQDLKAQGAEVVKADLGDKDSLLEALSGAHSVFAVTNYWERASKEVEVTQGKNVADISKEVGVKHLIWSSLPNVTKLSNGALPQVPHFDAKAEVEEYINTIGVPATFFIAGFYMSNSKSFIRKGEDGTYAMALAIPGNTPFPAFDAEADTGKFVAAILSKYSAQPLGKKILGATGWYTPEDMLRTFSEVTGETANFVQLPEAVFKGFLPESIAQEIFENLQWIKDGKYFGLGAHEELKKSLEILDTKATTYKEYLERAWPW